VIRTVTRVQIVAAGTIPNFRDLADATRSVVPGHSGSEGVVVRRRSLFRGPAHTLPNVTVAIQLRRRGVGTVIDLRTAAELARYGEGFPDSNVRRHRVPLLDATWRPPLRGESLPSYFAARYCETIDSAGGAMATVARLLVNDPAPALVHCTAGKDRTGLVIAVLLRAVGVSTAAVLEDFSRSRLEMCAVAALLARQERGTRSLSAPFRANEPKEPNEPNGLIGRGGPIGTADPASLLTVTPESLDYALDRMEHQHGGASDYLGAHGLSCGELEALRRRLIVEEPALAGAS
jgi:hypothetical protein